MRNAYFSNKHKSFEKYFPCGKIIVKVKYNKYKENAYLPIASWLHFLYDIGVTQPEVDKVLGYKNYETCLPFLGKMIHRMFFFIVFWAYQ